MKATNPTNAARKLTFGTAHFESRRAAVRYYRPYLGESESPSALYVRPRNSMSKDALAERMVNAKIAAGEIHIGPPALKPGQTLSLHREEGRYFITE
jgi:hypothetical protein